MKKLRIRKNNRKILPTSCAYIHIYSRKFFIKFKCSSNISFCFVDSAVFAGTALGSFVHYLNCRSECSELFPHRCVRFHFSMLQIKWVALSERIFTILKLYIGNSLHIYKQFRALRLDVSILKVQTQLPNSSSFVRKAIIRITNRTKKN